MAIETRPNNAENRIWLATEEALGSYMLVNERFISKLTGDDAIFFDERPLVAKWQLIQACVNAGFTEAQLNASAATLIPRRARMWLNQTEFDRDWPFCSALRSGILPTPPTPAQWSAIFVAASLMDPALF